MLGSLLEPDVKVPQQTRSRITQERLLDALEGLLRERSIHEVTVAEIAAAAGVTTGAIYRRFKDKRALLQAAFQRFLVDWRPPSEGALAKEAVTDDEILREVLDGTLDYTLAHMPLMRAAAAFDDLPSHEAMREARRDLAHLLAARLTSSRLGPEEIEGRTAFAMRTATAVIRDTFLSGPLAYDAREDVQAFRRRHEDQIEHLLSELVRMTALYLELGASD